MGVNITVMKHITERRAFKLWSRGKPVFLAPSNIRLGTPMGYPFEISPALPSERTADHWDKLKNEFWYYNCDDEMGNSILYFQRGANYHGSW